MINLWNKIFTKKDIDIKDTHVSSPIHIDIHSHLLPGIDDGSASLDHALEMTKVFEKMGYQKLITTPHVMGDFYRNTPEIIREKLAQLQDYLKTHQVKLTLEAAAEYYLDEWFIQKLKNNQELLTFGSNYLLFETGFMAPPKQLFEVIFEIQAQGYQPVFAHPERYNYLQDDFEMVQKMVERGVLLQLNLNSLNGYYGKPAKELAEKIIDQQWVSFLGTDCHKLGHLQHLQKSFRENSFQKISIEKLLNHSL